MKMLVLAVLLVIALGGARAQPFAPEARRWKTLEHGPAFDWPSGLGLEPATGPVTSEAVFSLFQDIDGSRWPDEPGITSPFRFAPLSRGKIYLLATFRGRSEAGFLEAAYCQQNRCFEASVNAAVDLNTDLVDVDGDGVLEVIGKECIQDCSGPARFPTFVYSIYKLVDGKGFIDYSAQAAGYYREHLLPKILAAENSDAIASKVAAINASVDMQQRRRMAAEQGLPAPHAVGIDFYKAAAQYAFDDYRRRVLGEKDAGLENAIHWLESEETWDLAMDALARIPNPTAEAKLLEAANSKNSRLAEMAHGFLRMRRELRAKGLLQ